MPADATAFATRDRDFILNVVARAPGADGFADVVNWARTTTDGVGANAATYVNFTGEASVDRARVVPEGDLRPAGRGQERVRPVQPVPVEPEHPAGAG
jgi:hypothetical protein